ncbi:MULTISPECIES: hypothetical protein [unclassified Lentimonas]|uniref:hypothetical protein n=1 Tax=unclassified Lentimonas TaxID=2630993 RepID=UPI001326E10C|nr:MULTISPECIES: hypothetical protein [unclassified Lentimonas]CAA6689715.1 Unannotated [Lentimonas sp. CC19]CAA6690478.1 Unannotated [Lentimonas sp. CC10]CAA7068736.1 Unannotated [Lentimonas sp. CC11]
MSEKATLLTSIPPVAKSSSTKKSSLLTSVDQSSKSAKSNDLQTDASTQSSEVISTTATELVSAEGQTITAFQGAIYGSFVLTFCLAGFAAVVLFRKASKVAEARFVAGAKTLAAASGLIALYGFFATYLFANYLKGEGNIPLFVTVALWVLVGPAIAVVLNYLLTPSSKPEKGAVIFDATAYFLIFACTSISLIPNIKEDAALIFSLLGGFLFIVPVARLMTAFRKAKARHPELKETSQQVLVYSLLFLPALLPLVGFANVCKMGDELTLFLFNFITFDFILLAGLSMIASADDLTPEQAAQAVKSTEKTAEVEVPEAGQPQPAVVEFSAPHQSTPKKLPPRKPVKAGSGSALPPAPRKPGSAGASATAEARTEAANAPSRIKAPSKPKKRF